MVGDMSWESFCSHYLCPLVLLDKSIPTDQCKIFMTDHLYPMMKHFYPDDSSPTHRA